MRILVTGGSGFVGLALCDALARRGDDVVSADLADPPAFASSAISDGISRQRLDITDRDAVLALVDATAPDAIVHAAAATPDGAREAAGNAAAIVAINVGGTANVVEAAARAGVPRVLALSSVAVYGRTLDDCAVLHEDMPPRPQTLYAMTKAAGEAIALRLGDVHGVAVTTPRVGILWGAFEHRTPLRTTPSPAFAMFEVARAGEDIVLPRRASAPLLHVDAAAQGLATLIDLAPSGIVNLGAPVSVDLFDMARAIAAHYGVAARVDAEKTNIGFFAVNRPPTDNARFSDATGQDLAGYDTALIGRHAEWLAAHHPIPVSQSAS